MSRQDRIAAALQTGLQPTSLSVIDESHQHAGHAGARPGGETHYRVQVTSEAFAGKSRIERHRLVNALLKDEFDGGLHALAIHAKSADE
ncbi:MAG: BolA family protein [Beijerinckiaceae bacterium]